MAAAALEWHAEKAPRFVRVVSQTLGFDLCYPNLRDREKSRYADNYALRILAGPLDPRVPDGYVPMKGVTIKPPNELLEPALKVIDGVSVVIDMSCFGTTILKLCRLLGWDMCTRHGGNLQTKNHNWDGDHQKIQPQVSIFFVLRSPRLSFMRMVGDVGEGLLQ
jgi:hypothetical protein